MSDTEIPQRAREEEPTMLKNDIVEKNGSAKNGKTNKSANLLPGGFESDGEDSDDFALGY